MNECWVVCNVFMTKGITETCEGRKKFHLEMGQLEVQGFTYLIALFVPKLHVVILQVQ